MRKDWIKHLPPGEYTIKDIEKMTGLISSPSIKARLLKYGASVKSVRIEGSNIIRDVFIWKGFPEVKENSK